MHGNEEFNDDGLKKAVCSAWADECCPHALHAKLRNVCGGSSQRSWWRGRIVAGLALAAAVLLGLSISVVMFAHRPLRAASQGVSQGLSPVLVADLIKTHDACCHSQNHQHVNAAIDDDAGIARELSGRLHQAVLVARPDPAEWVFRGAAVCPVGGAPAAHLLFVSGDDRISIFSLPASAAPESSTHVPFDDADGKHRVVAFEKDGGLFCLVGSGPDASAGVDQLIKMRDAMKADVTAPQVQNASAAPADDLMYAMR